MSNAHTTQADHDGNMLDSVAMGIIMLLGGLVLAFFGIDGVTDGVMVITEHVRNVWTVIADWALYLYGQFTFHFLSNDEGWV